MLSEGRYDTMALVSKPYRRQTINVSAVNGSNTRIGPTSGIGTPGTHIERPRLRQVRSCTIVIPAVYICTCGGSVCSTAIHGIPCHTRDSKPHPLGWTSFLLKMYFFSTTGRGGAVVPTNTERRVHGNRSSRFSQSRHFCCVRPLRHVPCLRHTLSKVDFGDRLSNSSQGVC